MSVRISVESLSGCAWNGCPSQRGIRNMECAGTFKTTSRTLAVGNPGKDGFASLHVVEKSTDSKNVPKPGDECEEVTDAPKTKTFTLNYDGSQYGVPKDLVL